LYRATLSCGRAGDVSTSEKSPMTSSTSSAKHSNPAVRNAHHIEPLLTPHLQRSTTGKLAWVAAWGGGGGGEGKGAEKGSTKEAHPVMRPQGRRRPRCKPPSAPGRHQVQGQGVLWSRQSAALPQTLSQCPPVHARAASALKSTAQAVAPQKCAATLSCMRLMRGH
jgi:hypothetical protein